NAALLCAQLVRLGCRVTAVRHVIDDDEQLRTLLSSSDFEAPDVWVSSGGISEGAFEVVRRVLSAEPDSEFLHVAMQPGGPQGLA
ncbi:molybdopterin-binding protein, partial [Klebsiella pneumoniae]|nr:molybdopterin-binding protein [Klebsiella pneumoniae]